MNKAIKKNELGLSTLKRVWSMLPLYYKRAAFKLWILMVMGALLEMIGVGLVIPVITLLTQPEALTQYIFFNALFTKLENASQQVVVIGAMALLLGVYLCKNFYLGFLAWRQSKFIYGLQRDLSQKLFEIYLRQPYAFHLQRNSIQLVRNLQGEMSMFINNAVSPTLLLFAELLVVTGMFILLILIEPWGSLGVIGILLLAALVFQRLTRNRISEWGKQRLLHDGYRTKQLHQGLGGVKDVKLLGREADFLDKYAFHTQQSMRMNQRQMTLQQLPKLWLELLAIISLAILLVSMTMQGKTIINIIPTLAVFAAVCFRLMPSANRIIGSVQQLRFGMPIIDMLYNELNLDELSEKKSNSQIEFEGEIELFDVSYAYPSTTNCALNSISIRIEKGAMVGFIGESGSGKSTLVDVVLGLLQPSHGRVLVGGKDITEDLRGWQSHIGYVPQSIYLTDDTLKRNVAFGLADKEIDDIAVSRALHAAQLDELVTTLPEGINAVVGERGVRLSGGQRQRIGIARALYHDPSVLVLDEATSALDMETEAEVMRAVLTLQGQKTILIVAHRLSTVERCDHIFRLSGGRIEDQGKPSLVLGTIN